MTTSSVFNEERFGQVTEALQALDDAEMEIEKAMQADIPVGNRLERIRELRTRLQKIRQTYYTGR